MSSEKVLAEEKGNMYDIGLEGYGEEYGETRRRKRIESGDGSRG
jgi:hypothetical protein